MGIMRRLRWRFIGEELKMDNIIVRKFIDYIRRIKTLRTQLIFLLFTIAITTIGCRSNFTLPQTGICAHRGASNTHPENTIAAFKEAISLGAHMIEFDVRLSKDKKLVIIHDATVDRTTNGNGKVAELTLAELKVLDAGSWKSSEFEGEKIPTLEEVLKIMPKNTWLNIHLKNDAIIGKMATKLVVEQNRLFQSFLACDKKTAESAKRENSQIKICNMDRQDSSLRYVDDTIAMDADFIQLKGRSENQLAEITRKLKQQNIRINYFGTNSAETLKMLFQAGVEFPLVDDLEPMMKIAQELGIQPLRPEY